MVDRRRDRDKWSLTTAAVGALVVSLSGLPTASAGSTTQPADVVAPGQAAGQAPTSDLSVSILVPDRVPGSTPTVRVGDTFTVTASSSTERVTRVEWFFRSGLVDGPEVEEPLGITRTAPYRLTFRGPARLYLGGDLVARAFGSSGTIREASVAVTLAGSAGRVPTSVRFALPYRSEAEYVSSRLSEGARVLGDPSPFFYPSGPIRRIRGFFGFGAVDLVEPGAYVQWAAKTSQGGGSDQPLPAGRYRLTFRYSNDRPAPVGLRLTTASAGLYDGQPAPTDWGPVTFPTTPRPLSQQGWRTVTRTVVLPAGISNIRLTTADGAGPLIDNLTITPAT